MSPASKNSGRAKSVSNTHAPQRAAAKNTFPIVGIGASAGGLEAFTQLLNHLPPDTGMAFVLVQHLSPDHPSQLSNLLSKATSMPVLEVKDGMPVKPNHVFVIPPNKNLDLAQGKLHLSARGDSRVASSVDHFFNSLAEKHEHCSIGVILSGTGSDGTVGLTQIKAMGGITFAQDEKSAKFSGMPSHAKLDSVDFIMPPDKIAMELARIALELEPATEKPKTETKEEVDEKIYLRILALLRLHTGADFSHYRDTTIKRRIQRRMLLRNQQTFEGYTRLLEKNSGELTELFNDVLINVTSFFRDAEMFEALKHHVFPEILKTKPQIIRVWVPGCSTGQEAYSLAIVLLEFLENVANAPAIQIFATDLRDKSIETGRRGIYAEGIENEVSPERLRRFFTKEDGTYRISKSIRDLCVFATQNVISDPPFSRIDLVSCRNMLIYLTPPLQRRAISTFHYALNPGGYLVLGQSETVGTSADLFEFKDRKHKIYYQKRAAIRPLSHLDTPDLKLKTPALGYYPPAVPAVPLDFQKEADRILLGLFAPAGVLINSGLEVLQFRGRTSPYLEPPTGEAHFNLLKMARGNLSLELATAIREAKKKKTSIRRNVRLDELDTVRKVDLQIIPLKLSGSLEDCFLVLFENADKAGRVAPQPVPKEPPVKKMSGDEKERELKQLRTELSVAREYVQATAEQYESSSEELKCSNEEVLSSNEELQSSNEQLGTAKEELQSTNEELQTLNDELRTRNNELSELNNDLNNLQGSVPVPVLIFGNDLRVRRYNPATLDFLPLKPASIGRPLHSIDSSLITPDLEKSMLEVIEKVVKKEMEIQDRDGRWLLLRLHPYRTVDNRIEGVIMTLVDIDALKRVQELQRDAANAALNESEKRFRLAADNAPVLLWMSNAEKLGTWFNKPWYEFTGRTPEQEQGDGWTEGVHPEDLPGCMATYVESFDARRTFSMEYRLRRHDGEYRWLLDQGIPNYRGAEFIGYIGSCIDITDRKRIEEELQANTARDKFIKEAAQIGFWWCDLPFDELHWDALVKDHFWLSPEAPVTIDTFYQCLHPEDRERTRHAISESITNHTRYDIEYRTVNQSGQEKWIRAMGRTFYDATGQPRRFDGLTLDVTERKRAAKTMEESFQREKQARETAEKASRAKDEFLAALSHELRTPLNPVLLIASDGAKNRDLPPEVRANFDAIRKNIELEARLIDDLLDLTRIVNGKLSFEMRELDAHTVLRDAIAAIQIESAEKQIQLKLKLKAKRHQVSGDSVRLQQVFWNVLKNAVKFTPKNGKITVETSVRNESRQLAVKITDTGIGMTGDELSRVFNAFSQGDHATTSSHRFGGLGLGLAISRQIVELHSGHIHAVSNGRNQGTCFTIELPMAKKEAENSSPKKKAPKDLTSQQKTQSIGARILLVEDHEPTRNALTFLLLRRHYKIFAATTLAEARRIAGEEKIDLVISDIGLPDGSGYELMSELRDGFGLKGIALTGYGMEHDVTQGKTAGFVAHLTKPVRIESLEKVFFDIF